MTLIEALLEEGDEEAFPLLATSVGKTFVGTPCYLAPEIEAIHQGGADAPIDESYGVAVDAWSLGAVVNVTLVARFPEFERSSAKSRVKVDTAAFRGVSPEARDLVARLMVPNPAERLTTRDALDHPWLSDDAERPSSPIKNLDDMALVPRKPETGEPVFRVGRLAGPAADDRRLSAECLRDVPGRARGLSRVAAECGAM